MTVRFLVFLLVVLQHLLMTGALLAQNKYAFIVGVQNYDPEFFQNLRFAESDATKLAGRLRSMGYATILMTSGQTNPQHKPTTPAKILRLLDGQLQAIGPADTFILSLSGHGIQFKSEEALEGGGKETYFVPEEGSLEDKESLLPIVKEIISRVDQCKAERKLVLIDACRNEVLSPSGDRSSKKIDLGSVHEHVQFVPKGMAVVFSCQGGQKSWENEELQHGVFTSFILEYLSGQASSDLYDGRLADASGMIEYARRKTNQYVIEKITPAGQYPERIGDVEQWPIGRVGPSLEFTSQFGHEMVLISEGVFEMGSPESEPDREDDEKQHRVQITKAFYMSAHEITVEQFRAFVTATTRQMPQAELGFDSKTASFIYGEYNWENPGWKQTPHDPVVLVSWQDATDYCQWLSSIEGRKYRLPSEAEWEYACRAGADTPHPFSLNEIDEHAFYLGEDLSAVGNVPSSLTSPVGQFRQNVFGMFDMVGNVKEWCHDFYGKTYYEVSPLQDPVGPADGRRRVIRGSAFNSEITALRSASRSSSRSDNRFPNVGFRIVCEVE
ncbi:MAG TPA: SUMF1/EgtB/PvdO family nonheme iron enzyme [Pirellulaceae bacterium]|nr:SUMF1/EgtB/PvdO family nonheme iron enzyme [Pirellulaceae bacterium]HMO93058.1 SUMF1/EgtB/PvdO family nonheme iron enzyme [Pirellulaceae bacterium]HMP69688.1 SUMF1/EgtB/PvdO family nonheme iron enzyme [Pirellulaceae bacterium]